MRVAMVIDQYDALNNGTTVTARRCAEELRARGHIVTILAGGRPEKDKIAVRKMRLPIFQPLVDKQGFCLAQGNDEAYYEAFHNADIAHFYLPSWFCRRGEAIARQLRVPTVAAFHLQPENISYNVGLGKSKWVNDFLYRYFYYSFYNRFRYIHCPSEMIAAELKQHGYDACCRVISNGVSDLFRPVDVARPPQLQGKFVVLMIGRLSGEKRQDLIIEAARRSKYGDRIQLVFAGRGPKEDKYRQLGKSLPHEPIIGFYSQEDLLALINVSDLYVHASDAETEGISCMEAMACGLTPVISDSKLCATKAFALHPYSLFHTGDANSLAERIDYWIEHPRERVETGRLCAQKADQMRVGRCVEEIDALYREVIADYRAKGYKRPEETRLRRATHPDADRVNPAYAQMNFFQRTLFAGFTNFLTLLAYVVDSVFLGFKVKGKKELKKVKGGAVTVMNHVHPLDCTMVKIAVFPRRICFTSLRQNLELPFIGWLIKFCGALSLPDRWRDMLRFQRQLRQCLERGDWVHYYPEGLLVRDHRELSPFYAGAFFTAVNNNCPVIPMVITFLSPRGFWRWAIGKQRMLLSIGEPQYPDKTLSHKEAATDLTERTGEIMRRMLNEPASEEELSLSVFVRIACLLFLIMEAFKLLGLWV